MTIDPQTIKLAIYAYIGVSVGSAMPNRKDYDFSRPIEVFYYCFDWIYGAVKIITLNALKELEKKGLPKLEIPPQQVEATVSTEPKPPAA